MSEPIASAASARVLILDDEESVLITLRETLLRAGYHVKTQNDPLQALEALKTEPFSVIITDQHMPLLTGLEFLAEAKRHQPNAARILITGMLSLDTVIDAINQGEIFRFIVKPWLREELLATVRNAVQRYELICSNNMLQATTLAMNEQLKELNTSFEAQVARVAEQNEQLARLNHALEQTLQHSVELSFQTLQTFYPALGSQARRVFELCKTMADTLQLAPEQRQVLLTSAWLHDIGLVGVPRHLIRKWQERPEELTPAESVLIEQHPILGQELIQFVCPELEVQTSQPDVPIANGDLVPEFGAGALDLGHGEAVGQIIRAHHERFDGLGYPDRLSAGNIPWLARLLIVAVAFAESRYNGDDAIRAIEMNTGTAFDPEAVRVLLGALPETALPRLQREVLLSELRPGMVLAKGIYTPTGLLLLPEGELLTETYIDKLQNHNRISPINQSLLISC